MKLARLLLTLQRRRTNDVAMLSSQKVLVLGQGGREHALVRALRMSPRVDQVHVLPGSDGIAQEAICHRQFDCHVAADVLRVVREHQINFVVVGPEGPLASGLVDELMKAGVAVFGPSQKGAKLESSKIFAKQFMLSAGVPTAQFVVVDSVAQTILEAEKFAPPYVLKADGLASGKGVFICPTLAELEQAAKQLFDAKILGEAGARAVLEQFMPGEELSYLVLTNGESWRRLPLARDHKKLLAGDQGPNTGGMGALAPIAISAELDEQIKQQILSPVMAQMRKEKMQYRGVLYVGLMLTSQGPQVLEFNTRFGDPETQAILPLIEGDFCEHLQCVARGKLPEFKEKMLYTCCLVLAAPGYPDHPQLGLTIDGDLTHNTPNSYFLHAGTRREERLWLTNGGRVLNAIGLGSSAAEARTAAYAQAERVSWRGMLLRADIGVVPIE